MERSQETEIAIYIGSQSPAEAEAGRGQWTVSSQYPSHLHTLYCPNHRWLTTILFPFRTRVYAQQEAGD